MRYKFTNDTRVRIILNTMHARFRIQIHVIRLEQWPKTSKTAHGKGECENCTWVRSGTGWMRPKP